MLPCYFASTVSNFAGENTRICDLRPSQYTICVCVCFVIYAEIRPEWTNFPHRVFLVYSDLTHERLFSLIPSSDWANIIIWPYFQ